MVRKGKRSAARALLLLTAVFVFILGGAESPTAAGLEIALQQDDSAELDALVLEGLSEDIGSERSVEQPALGRTRVKLALSDPLDLVLRLKVGANEGRFRVLQRYETSLTLMNEGPHLDLRNWKHFRSPWTELPSAGEGRFALAEIVRRPFPDVTREQIVEAVREELESRIAQGIDAGEQWVKLARRCEAPSVYPCAVALSRVEMQVQQKRGDEWETVQILELILPMGC